MIPKAVSLRVVRKNLSGTYYVQFKGWMTLWLFWRTIDWPYDNMDDAVRLMNSLYKDWSPQKSTTVMTSDELEDK